MTLRCRLVQTRAAPSQAFVAARAPDLVANTVAAASGNLPVHQPPSKQKPVLGGAWRWAGCVCVRTHVQQPPTLPHFSLQGQLSPPNSLFCLLCSHCHECHFLTLHASPSPVSAPLCDPIGGPGLGLQKCGVGREVEKDPEVLQGYTGKWGNVGRPQAK